MKNIWTWITNNPIRFMFLIPILLVAVISISHVVSWYDLANPLSWAVYLSIAIEVGAMTALVAATNRIKGGVWFMFGLVTFIQMVGNIFFSFKEVDTDGALFKSWIELTAPVFEVLGSEPTDLTAMKRWLAFLEGGLLPIISLTSLHFFVKFDENNPNYHTPVDPTKELPETIVKDLKSKEEEEEEEDEEDMISPESVTNPTYEITKEIYESNEKQIVEDEVVNEPVNEVVNEPVNERTTEGVNEGVNEGVTEGVTEEVIEEVNDDRIEELSDLQTNNESIIEVIETTETINDDIRDILEEIGDEVIVTENEESTDEYSTTTTTIYKEPIKRLSYVKQS